MSDLSPHLELPYLLPGQAQKHVTVNEALARLDLVVQATVSDRTRTTAPVTPAEGDRHIVAAGATGVWAGQDGRIAHFTAAGWTYVAPRAGWRVHVLAEARGVVFDGSLWVGPESQRQRFAELGISTDADATNRLAVAAPASLFSHAGAGHQMKLNKAAPADTASLLYQTGFSGRAEIGLTGSDNLAVKVSADGSAWTTALTIAAAGGRVEAGAGLTLAPGAAATPGLAFLGDADTGLFHPGADVLALAAGGAERARVTAAGMQVTGLLSGTAVTQSVTDATAGRLLKVGDFGIGGEGLQVTDLNTVVTNGLYRLAGSATNAPAGITTSSLLVVRFGTLVQQWLFEGSSIPRLWMRRSADGGTTWPTAWAYVYGNRNILGTVSQSSGNPTGAVIERGSNANGEFMRLADGTQICSRSLTASAGAGTVWTYPAVFAAAPLIDGTAVATVLSAVCLDAAPTTTAATLSARDKADARRADVLHLTATGRWF
jgi:hypothetical protein